MVADFGAVYARTLDNGQTEVHPAHTSTYLVLGEMLAVRSVSRSTDFHQFVLETGDVCLRERDAKTKRCVRSCRTMFNE